MAPHESWSSFRRSGYPAIAPNPLTGDLTSEPFFRRLLYAEAELNLNPNYADGTLPDIMDTRVWWDVDMAGQNGVDRTAERATSDGERGHDDRAK